MAGHVPWEHDGCWFDSSLLDCDVRELANPVHCECTFDGIETRTSPPASADGFGGLPPKQQRARSTRAGSTMLSKSTGVDGSLSSCVEEGSIPFGSARAVGLRLR